MAGNPSSRRSDPSPTSETGDVRSRTLVARGLIARVPRRSARPAPGRAPGTGAHIGRPTLDDLGAHWRLALFAAQDALAAARAGGRSTGLSALELSTFERRLAEERIETDRLLVAVAHEERVELHHRLTTPRATARTLGLPPEVRACLFDLDGVLTGSAEIHAAAWRESINDFLSLRFERAGERFGPLRPFSARRDYYRYLHGKPRSVGAHAFLASRGIRLPEGHPDDPIDAETVYGLTNHKNAAFQRRLEQEGIRAFAGSIQYLDTAREAGVRCAVISASANTEATGRDLHHGSTGSWMEMSFEHATWRASPHRTRFSWPASFSEYSQIRQRSSRQQPTASKQAEAQQSPSPSGSTGPVAPRCCTRTARNSSSRISSTCSTHERKSETEGRPTSDLPAARDTSPASGALGRSWGGDPIPLQSPRTSGALTSATTQRRLRRQGRSAIRSCIEARLSPLRS